MTDHRVAALPAAGPRIRFMVGVSQRTWRPPAGLQRVRQEAVMRTGKLFVGSGIRYVLHESLGFLIQPHDFARVDLPDRLFWLYALLRPVFWLRRALCRPQRAHRP